MDNSRQSLNTIYITHLVLLFLGWSAGCVAAYFFNLIPFDFSAEIQKAKDLGITSVSILSGYPKSRDTFTYITTLFFPVICSIGLWYLWARKHMELLKSIFRNDGPVNTAKDRKWSASLILIISFYLLASYNINGFYWPGWSPRIGAWIFLGEEGANLAWAQSILSGGVYGKDFYCLYGPMLIYPLSWAMKVFGASVLTERFFRYFLDLAAYGIIIFFLYRTLKSKTIFVLSSIIYLAIFPPFVTVSINFTYLRFVLGILPLLLMYLYLESRKRYLLLLMGIIIGQSFLFSQEAGLCSFIALTVSFCICYITQKDYLLQIKELLLIPAGLLISVAPMLIYLYLKGAVVPFLNSIYGYPKLVTLGYGGLPFPALDKFLADPFGYPFFFYWVIFLYGFLSIYLVSIILLSGKMHRGDLLRVSLLIFGVLLFKVALGRSSHENIYKVLHPAVLLLFLYIDSSVAGVITQKKILKVGHVIMVCLLLSSTFLLSAITDHLKNTLKLSSFVFFQHKWSVKIKDHQIPYIERGGILFDKDTAGSIKQLYGFLNANTGPGDYVYFFPNEAAYYFLFDRNNPTRYAISYFAVTSRQRKELIADLEKNRPAYVVYSKKTWRVDGISEYFQVPEVVGYLLTKYKPFLDLGDILIMNRVGT
jgi:hypothetical protein